MKRPTPVTSPILAYFLGLVGSCLLGVFSIMFVGVGHGLGYPLVVASSPYVFILAWPVVLTLCSIRTKITVITGVALLTVHYLSLLFLDHRAVIGLLENFSIMLRTGHLLTFCWVISYCLLNLVAWAFIWRYYKGRSINHAKAALSEGN